MLRTDEVRSRIADYVLSEVSLGEFEDWFVANSWNACRDLDEDLQRLVYQIEAKLAEHSGGHIDEDVLRKALARLIAYYSVAVTIGDEDPRSTTKVANSSQAITVPAEMKIAFVHIQPEVAYG